MLPDSAWGLLGIGTANNKVMLPAPPRHQSFAGSLQGETAGRAVLGTAAPLHLPLRFPAISLCGLCLTSSKAGLAQRQASNEESAPTDRALTVLAMKEKGSLSVCNSRSQPDLPA